MTTKSLQVISDSSLLARYGVCKVRIPDSIDKAKWAAEFSQVTPSIIAGEGDGQYAFYRNILEEPDFPFDSILNSEIGNTILQHFDVSTLDEIRLDDAFCIHYNMEQEDTSGAKHTDPSDITVNLCLEKTSDAAGSQVSFHGTKPLANLDRQPDDDKDSSFRFLVDQEAGYATLHWGSHPHETTSLTSGKRTNIVMTYCYRDPTRSDAATRTCYSLAF